jgi:hypothetical protein
VLPAALHFKLEPERWLRRAVTSVEPVVTDPRIERRRQAPRHPRWWRGCSGSPAGGQPLRRAGPQAQLRIRRNGVIAGCWRSRSPYDGGPGAGALELGGDETLLDGAWRARPH